MDNLNHEVRLALLEKRMDVLEDTVSINHKDVTKTLTVIDEKLDAIQQAQLQQKSFIGGVLLSFSAIATAITFAKDYLKPFFNFIK